MSTQAIDPILVSVIQRRLKSITEEMGLVMLRTARSPILSEARDFVTGLYDAQGRMLEQTEYVPILAFAVPPALKQIIAYFGDDLSPGDVIIHNDPFTGGNQLADVKVAKPIFLGDQLIAWAVINGHQADVGGSVAGGYNPNAREIWQEALRMTPVKIYEKGKVRRDVWNLIFSNIRFSIVEEDIKAAMGGCAVGERQLLKLVERYGWDRFAPHVEHLFSATEKMMRHEIETIPDGEYVGEHWAFFDAIRPGSKMKIRVTVKVKGDNITFDFTGSSEQTPGYVNAPFSSMASATLLSFLMCINPDLPHNDGLVRPIKIEVPEGSFLNPRFPAATTFGNRLSDQISSAIFKALSQAVPHRVTAGWNSSHVATVVGQDPRYGESYVDIVFLGAKGGGGATDGIDGYDHIGMISCGGGILAQDPEVFESRDPHLIERFEYAQDSAGAGEWRGGLGVELKFRFQGNDTMISAFGDGIEPEAAAFGLFDGGNACPNRSELIFPDGTRRLVQSKELIRDVPTGTYWHQIAGGGGGYGDPRRRPVQKVVEEVRCGYLSVQAARERYGVVLNAETLALDEAATAALRAG